MKAAKLIATLILCSAPNQTSVQGTGARHWLMRPHINLSPGNVLAEDQLQLRLWKEGKIDAYPGLLFHPALARRLSPTAVCFLFDTALFRQPGHRNQTVQPLSIPAGSQKDCLER